MPVRRLSGCVLSWRNVEIQCWLPFLSSDDPAAMEPKVQRSIGSSGTQPVSFPLLFTMIPVLLALMLRWGWQPRQRLSKAHAGHWDHETLRLFFYTDCFIWACTVLSCLFAWMRNVDRSKDDNSKSFSYCFIQWGWKFSFFNIYNANFSVVISKTAS